MFLNTAEEANHTLKKSWRRKMNGIKIDGEAFCVPSKLYRRIWTNIVQKTLFSSAA